MRWIRIGLPIMAILVVGVVGCGGGGGISADDGHKGVGAECFERVTEYLHAGGIEPPKGMSVAVAEEFIEETCEESSPNTTIERVAARSMISAQLEQIANSG